jgi:hypothetical protein
VLWANVHATASEGSYAQPLTRADCDATGFAWDENGNVCDWQANSPKAQLAAAPIEEITAAIPSGQPLTRADCDATGFAWDENGNVCDWQERRT